MIKYDVLDNDYQIVRSFDDRKSAEFFAAEYNYYKIEEDRMAYSKYTIKDPTKKVVYVFKYVYDITGILGVEESFYSFDDVVPENGFFKDKYIIVKMDSQEKSLEAYNIAEKIFNSRIF